MHLRRAAVPRQVGFNALDLIDKAGARPNGELCITLTRAHAIGDVGLLSAELASVMVEQRRSSAPR